MVDSISVSEVENETQPDAQAEVKGLASERGVQQPGMVAPAQVFGVVVSLMMESPAHQHLFLTDMKWLVIPPVMLRQFRLFRRNGVPFAYASWANLTEEAETRIKQGKIRLRPDEWNAGDRLWLVDLVAPFGGQQNIYDELSNTIFKGKKLNSLKGDMLKLNKD